MIKKLKWYGKDGIDSSWELPSPEDLTDYKQYILEHTNFVSILKQLKLRVELCNTGKYTHRMTCPFKFHKSGKERTPSFRLHDKNNIFTCYGCNESGNILRFLQLYSGGSDQYNLQRLATIAGLINDGELQLPQNYLEPEPIINKETNYKILFDAGLLLRNYLLEIKNKDTYTKECEWADQMLIKLDKHFQAINDEDLIGAKQIYDKLNKTIDKRKK